MANLNELEAQIILEEYANRVIRRFGTRPPDYPLENEEEDQSLGPAGNKVFLVEDDGTVRPYYGSPGQEAARISRPPQSQTTGRGRRR